MNITRRFHFTPLALALLLLPGIAAAQQVDPRIVNEMVTAQRAELALRDAALKAMAEDQAKREKDLSDWFKGWFSEAPQEPSK